MVTIKRAFWQADNPKHVEAAIDLVLQTVDERWINEYGSIKTMDLIGVHRMPAMIAACNQLMTWDVEPPLTNEEFVLISTLKSDMEITFPREMELNSPPHLTPSHNIKRGDRPGYVYLIQASTGHWKIGLSRVPVKRISKLEVILPFDIEVQALIKTDDMYYLEAELHVRFDSKRIRGEWFDLSSDDVAYIKSLEVQDE